MKESPKAREVRTGLCRTGVAVGLSLPADANALTVKQVAEGLPLLRAIGGLKQSVLQDPATEAAFRGAVVLLGTLKPDDKWSLPLAEAIEQWRGHLEPEPVPASLVAQEPTTA